MSGGERKRVAVAAELVTRPPVLLLDEPTSGLDSTAARALIETLKSLCRRGHSVAVVVHQPRTAIFELFDDLLLLSGGRTVYRGSPGGARRCLESCPGVPRLPDQTGIADWMMDVIKRDEDGAGKKNGGDDQKGDDRDRDGDGDRHRRGGMGLAEHWIKNDRSPPFDEGGESRIRRTEGRGPPQFGGRELSLSTLAQLNAGSPYRTTFVTQLRSLMSRSMKQQRGERLTRVALIVKVAYAFLTGIIWFRMPDDVTRIYSRKSLCFFLLIAQSNHVVIGSMTTFFREREILLRDRSKKMYGVLPYFIAKTAGDVTHSLLLPTLYACAVYWIAGLRPTPQHFLTFALVFYVTVSTAQANGLFLSAAIPDLRMGLMLAPAINLFLIVLGGFYVPIEDLHPAVRWASRLSFARYGFAALVSNEFGGRDVPCADPDSARASSDDLGDRPRSCPIPGWEILEGAGIPGGSFGTVWPNVAVLLGMQIALRVACYVVMRRRR